MADNPLIGGLDSFGAFTPLTPADVAGNPFLSGAGSGLDLSGRNTLPTMTITPSSSGLGGGGTSFGVPSLTPDLTAGGGTPSATAGTAGTSAASALSPTSWINTLGAYAGQLATRGGLILLAIVLLMGAVYLFASRTQAVATSAHA